MEDLDELDKDSYSIDAPAASNSCGHYGMGSGRVLHLSTSTHVSLKVDRIDVLVSGTEIELIE